jgi:hypothetical protein
MSRTVAVGPADPLAWMAALRLYLLLAAGLVLARIVTLAVWG